MPEVIFRGQDVYVHGADYQTPVVIVTFTTMDSRADASIQRTGFCEKPLKNQKVSYVAVFSNSNHWWQTHEMDGVCKAVRDYCAKIGAEHVTTFGASMGAYGALMFADRIGAQDALAMAPQFSIDRTVMPEEARWMKYSESLDFVDDDMGAAVQGRARRFVIYDPYSLDAAHVDKMQGRRVRKVPLPLAGHAVGQFIKEAGELRPILGLLQGGDLKVHRVRKIAARAYAKRRETEHYYVALMQYFGRRRLQGHARLHDALIAKVCQNSPKNAKGWLASILVLISEGDIASARQMLRAYEDDPNRAPVSENSLDHLRSAIEAAEAEPVSA